MTYIVGDATHIMGRPLSGALASGDTWEYDGEHLVPAPNEAYKHVNVHGAILTANQSADTLFVSGVSGAKLTAASDSGGAFDTIVLEVSGLTSGQIPDWTSISGMAAGGSGLASETSGIATGASGVAVGASGIAVGASGIASAASEIALGGSGIATGASGIASAASGIAETAADIAVGGSGIASAASAVAATASGMAAYASGKLHDTDGGSGFVLASGVGLILLQTAPSSGSVLKSSGTNILTDLYWGVDQTSSGGGSGSGNSYAFIDVHGAMIDANAADDTLHLSGRSGIRLTAASGAGQGEDTIFAEVSGLASAQIPNWAEISGMASGGSGLAFDLSGIAVAAGGVASGASGIAVAASGIAVAASGIAVAAVTPDYTPPAFLYKDPDEIRLPKGRYYKAGYRRRGQYQDTVNMAQYWDLSSMLAIDIDAVYASGSSPGMIGGAKVNNSWYSVFLLGNTANDVIVLPFVRIKAVAYSAPDTVINPGDHNTGGSNENGFLAADDAWNNYRLVKISYDDYDGELFTIADSVNGTPDQVIISGNVTSKVAAGQWLQMAPPAATACLYLGVVRIDGSGNLLGFSKKEWSYEMGARIGCGLNLGTSFGDSELAAAVPPAAQRATGTMYVSSSATSCTRCMIQLPVISSDVDGPQIHQWQNSSGPQIMYVWAPDLTLTLVAKLRNKAMINTGSWVAAPVAEFQVVGFSE